MSGHRPFRDLKLHRAYGLTFEQLDRLPIEVYDLLCTLPVPPQPKVTRARRAARWLTKPGASITDVVVICGAVFAFTALTNEARWPWWGALLAVWALWSAGVFATSAVRSFAAAARLYLRRPR